MVEGGVHGGVVAAEYALAVGEDLAAGPFGFGVPSLAGYGQDQVVAGGQGFWMILTECVPLPG